MQPIYDWFRDFYERTGINLNFIYDDFDRARIIKGFFLTLELAVITIILSILVGIAGAWLQGSKLVWIRRIVAGFISFFRNTPPLVQIYFFYFGLGYLLPRMPDGSGALIPMSPTCSGRSSRCRCLPAPSISRSSAPASRRSPSRRWRPPPASACRAGRVYRLVVLPMAIRVCLPALGNNLVNLVKTTNLAYAIAVPELLYVSKQIWSDATNVREMMIFVLFAYLSLVFVLVGVLNVIERRLAIPGFGQDRGQGHAALRRRRRAGRGRLHTGGQGDAARRRAHRHPVRRSWSASARRWRWRSSRRWPRPRSLEVLMRWAPLLLWGFAFNILISIAGHGRRHGGRLAGRHRPAVAVCDRARGCAHRHAALPQLAVAGAAVPLHVPDPLRDPRSSGCASPSPTGPRRSWALPCRSWPTRRRSCAAAILSIATGQWDGAKALGLNRLPDAVVSSSCRSPSSACCRRG